MFHQVQYVILCNAIQKKLRKYMMKKFHAKDTTFLNFLPQIGNLGFLRNKIWSDYKELKKFLIKWVPS